jgi:hypothetical protein
MAHVEQSKALSRKAKSIAFLLWRAKQLSKTKKTSKCKKEKYLIDCLLPLAHTPWPHLYNLTLISLQPLKPTPIFLQLNL